MISSAKVSIPINAKLPPLMGRPSLAIDLKDANIARKCCKGLLVDSRLLSVETETETS